LHYTSLDDWQNYCRRLICLKSSIFVVFWFIIQYGKEKKIRKQIPVDCRNGCNSCCSALHLQGINRYGNRGNYIFNSLHNFNFRHCIWCIFLLDQGWREMAILCQQHSKPNRQGHQKKNRRTRPRSMTSSSISSTIFD